MAPNFAARVGVLAVQGDVIDHMRLIEQCGAQPVRVRTEKELNEVDGLILPGGESTTMVKLLRAFDLFDPLYAKIADGLPVYGSCAGMILLADEILDGAAGQSSLHALPVTVRRNAFGRQVASFEADIDMVGVSEPEKRLRAVFIRAPWIESNADSVDVLATVAVEGNEAGVGEAIVAVRQGHVMATSFHPEVTDDPRVHAYFLREVVGAR